MIIKFIIAILIYQPLAYCYQPSLAEYISTQFKRPIGQAQKIVSLAEKHAYPDFPKKKDVLAVIATESGFRPQVSNKSSNGLMQVNHASFELEANIKAGIGHLRSNYLAFGSRHAAYHAYNLGQGAYRKGKRVPGYVAKVLGHTAELSTIEGG